MASLAGRLPSTSGFLWSSRARILAAVEFERGSRYVDKSAVVLAYIGLGEKAKAVELIEEEYGNKASWLADLGYDVVYDSIRGEPGVQEILRKLGLK